MAAVNRLDGLLLPLIRRKPCADYPATNLLQRTPIEHVLDTGVRPINALLTVGRGQRMGLFAGSGVGKSAAGDDGTLALRADVIVVGLIGERGREVKDFINILVPEGARPWCDCRPADVFRPANAGCRHATRIAEDFRDRGQHVLLIMDFTWLRGLQREIALAIGEPLTLGYPLSVFLQITGYWSSVPEMALAAADRLLRFISCLPRAMTSRTPLPTPGAGNPRRSHCAVSPTGGSRALSGYRYVDQPRNDGADQRATCASTHLQTAVVEFFSVTAIWLASVRMPKAAIRCLIKPSPCGRSWRAICNKAF